MRGRPHEDINEVRLDFRLKLVKWRWLRDVYPNAGDADAKKHALGGAIIIARRAFFGFLRDLSTTIKEVPLGPRDAPTSTKDDPVEIISREERSELLKQCIRRVLDTLDERWRLVIVERLWHDATLSEAGKLIGVSHTAVRRNEANFMARLRAELAEVGWEDPDAK